MIKNPGEITLDNALTICKEALKKGRELFNENNMSLEKRELMTQIKQKVITIRKKIFLNMLRKLFLIK